MTRLNALVTDSFIPEASPAQNILTDLLADVMRGMTATSDVVIGSADLPPHVVDFFENYYVKHDLAGKLPEEVGPVSRKLSSGEAELVRFMVSGDLRKEKVYILCDHAGKGKSTLAKYICWYLIPREATLSAAVLPVYLSIFDHTEAIQALKDRAEVDRYLDNEIQRLAFGPAYDHFCKWCPTLLEEANRGHDAALQGRFPPKTVQRAAADPASWFSKQSDTRRQRLGFYSLMDYARRVRPVVIVLDDADRLALDTQRFALEYLYRRITLGAFGVLAMRRSTYRAIRADIRDKEHHVSQPIRWSPDTIRDMLTRRLQTAERKVALRWPMRHDTTERDIVDAFVNVISRPDAVELLAALSNENLHSLFGKIQMIAHSRYFRDAHVLRELLVSEIRESARTNESATGAQLWVVLSMLLGNHAETFKSSEDAAGVGVVNVFCTRELNHSPLTQFIRLQLLSRLFTTQRERDALPVKSIREEHMSLFGDDTHFTPVFARALRRLIVGGLIFTSSCRRYQDDRSFWPQIIDDALFIAPAGRYYLVRLITFIEYLWFMKDDIDWLRPPRFKHATTDAHALIKARGTLDALHDLMKLEYQMLGGLTGAVAPGMSKAHRYADLFSARRIPGSRSVLFTSFMYEQFRSYLGRKFSDYDHVFARQIEEVDSLNEANSRIRVAFS